jgi:sporulation protein YlmC with PRC-barrel domain
MRKHIALMATVAALAVSPALAQTTHGKAGLAAGAAGAAFDPGSVRNTGSGGRRPRRTPSTQAMPAERFVDMQASGQWLASDLMGLNVVGSNNENIGSVSDLLVDEEGNIHAAIVGVGGFLGIGQKDVAISFESFNITRDEDGDPEAASRSPRKSLRTPRSSRRPSARVRPQRPATPRSRPTRVTKLSAPAL